MRRGIDTGGALAAGMLLATCATGCVVFGTSSLQEPMGPALDAPAPTNGDSGSTGPSQAAGGPALLPAEVSSALDRFVGVIGGNPAAIGDKNTDRTAAQQADALRAQLAASGRWTADIIQASLPAARTLRDRLLERRPQFEVVLLLQAWADKMGEGALDSMKAGLGAFAGLDAALSKGDLSDADVQALAAGTERLKASNKMPTKEIQDVRTSAVALLVAGTNIRYYEDPRTRRKAWEALRAERKTGLDMSIAIPALQENLGFEEEPAVKELGTAVLSELRR